MKFYLLVTVIALVLTTVNGQTSTTAPASTPTPATTNWTILNLDAGQRDNLCQRQLSYCATSCGNSNAATTNFCNVTSMAWNCQCSNANNGTSAVYLDPVPLAECTGKEVACQAACPADSTRSGCVQACTNYYSCGTPNAPASYLQTQNANDVPSYNGPPPAASSSSSPSNMPSTTTSTSTSTQQSWAVKIDAKWEMALIISLIGVACFQFSL